MDKAKAGDTSRHKLGELLLEAGVISEEQLEAALRRQESAGGRLGRNLLQLNFLSEDVLIKFLSSQLGIPSVNLNKETISPEVQRIVPLELVQKHGILPVGMEEYSLQLGMTDPTDIALIAELEFSLGLKIVPLALAESQWEYAVNFFSDRGWGSEPMTKRIKAPRQVDPGYDLDYLLRELVAHKGSDLHLTVGVQPTFRIQGQLVRLNTVPLSAEKLAELLSPVLGPERTHQLGSLQELDFGQSFQGLGRFRFSIYRQKNDLAAAVRRVKERIPSASELGLPSWISEFVGKPQGLILITGPSGHGTSTTMACLIDMINTTRRVNIVTVEDPIEYVHRHKAANVNQREIGTDTSSFREAMRCVFRQDPDVVALGEMRDAESVSMALSAAETGHLVLATLHTRSAMGTIDRIMDLFPSSQHGQIRSQLAGCLLLIFSQRLLSRSDGAGKVLACEKLANSYRVQNAIRENRFHLIRGQSVAAGEDYSPLESALAALARDGVVSYEEGLRFAEDRKLYDTLAGR